MRFGPPISKECNEAPNLFSCQTRHALSWSVQIGGARLYLVSHRVPLTPFSLCYNPLRKLIMGGGSVPPRLGPVTVRKALMQYDPSSPGQVSFSEHEMLF